MLTDGPVFSPTRGGLSPTPAVAHVATALAVLPMTMPPELHVPLMPVLLVPQPALATPALMPHMLIWHACAQSQQPQPMPDDPMSTPDDKPLHPPREGANAMPTVASTLSAPPTLSPAVQPLPRAVSTLRPPPWPNFACSLLQPDAKVLKLSWGGLVLTLAVVHVASVLPMPLPAAPGPLLIPASTPALPPLLNGVPLLLPLPLPGLPQFPAVALPAPMAPAALMPRIPPLPVFWHLLLSIHAPGQQLLPMPDNKLFHLPRGAMLMPADGHAAPAWCRQLSLSLSPSMPLPVSSTLPQLSPLLLLPPTSPVLILAALPLPDIVTLPRPIIPTGASDSTASVALNVIGRACQGVQRHVIWMRRMFQVF